MSGRSSSGIGKITVIGCIWVTTAMPGGVAGLDVISRIDQAQADAAGDRRDDVAVDDVELLLIDLRLIELHRAFVLLHDVDLILILLAGDRILLGQFLVARQVDLAPAPAGPDRARAGPRIALAASSIGPRVDLREEIALLDHLAFGEGDLQQLTVDLGLHRDGGDRRHGAERVDDDADIALADGGGADRLRRALQVAWRAAGWLRRVIGAVNPDSRRPTTRDQNDQADDQPGRAAALRLNNRTRAPCGEGPAPFRRPMLRVRSSMCLVVEVRLCVRRIGSL